MKKRDQRKGRPLRTQLLISVVIFVPLVIGVSVYTAFNRSGPLPAIKDGLVAHWVFHSNLGSRAKDSVGGQNGLIHNPSWVTGRGYLALKFDGKTTYIEVPPVGACHAMPLQDSFTIAAWINPESRQRQVLLQKTDPSGDLRAAPLIFYAPWGEGRLGLVLSNGTRRVGFLSDGVIRSGRWQHVAVTFDDETGQICFYIDGEESGKRTTTVRPCTLPQVPTSLNLPQDGTPPNPPAGSETPRNPPAGSKPAGGSPEDQNTVSNLREGHESLLIGVARSTSGEKFHFQGELDSLSLYNRALTPQEVQALLSPG